MPAMDTRERTNKLRNLVECKQRGAFVNGVKASGTSNTFKAMAAKLKTAAKKNTAGNRLANGYLFKRLSMVVWGDAKCMFNITVFL